MQTECQEDSSNSSLQAALEQAWEDVEIARHTLYEEREAMEEERIALGKQQQLLEDERCALEKEMAAVFVARARAEEASAVKIESLEAELHRVKTELGEAGSSLKICFDMSERRDAEERARETEAEEVYD